MTKKYLQGGISFFIVVASCLFVSIIAISFVRLVNREQSSATNQDLSQSAYDSAQVGVEDAKRALLKWQQSCDQLDASDPNSDCSKMTQALKASQDGQSCNILSEVFSIGDPSTGETLIQTSEGDVELNQAYTCVKINLNSVDFLGNIPVGDSKIIPLKVNGLFSKIRVSWFNQEDAGSSEVNLSDQINRLLNVLPPTELWPTSRPSIARIQVLPSGDIQLTDGSDTSRQKTDTVFGYPTSNGTVDSRYSNTTLISLGSSRQFNESTLSAVKCHNSLDLSSYSGYACSATIDLGGIVDGQAGALLRLAFQYGSNVNYRVEVIDDSNNNIYFDGVQPVVDSTGRANDSFRRVESRLEIDESNIPVPTFSVYSEGQFCKTAIIRDNTKQSTIECR